MAWTKAKTAIVAAVATVAIIGTTTSTIILTKGNPNQQRLKDGSVLSISQVSFGDTHNIVINGKTNHWGWPGHPELVLMLKLSGKNASNNPLVRPPFFRPLRCMIHGESGIEFAAEIAPQGFKKSGGEYYGEIQTEILPRDSRYLWLRFEQSPTNRPYGSWQKVAEFKIHNPAPATNNNWTANATPTTNTVEGTDFVLRDVTLKTNADDERDIWNHTVTIPTEVWTNGVRLTNWSPAYIQAGDASGNSTGNFQMHRSLDPRFIWRLGMDFEMVSNFPPKNVFTVPLRRQGNAPLVTNVMDVPVTISWNGQWVDAEMPTNRSDLALKFVSVTDRNGDTGAMGSGSWNQFGFREGSFYAIKNGVYNQIGQPVTVTFAVVPNIHTIFYVQPKLINE
jgi:hypothetical protein